MGKGQLMMVLRGNNLLSDLDKSIQVMTLSSLVIV